MKKSTIITFRLNEMEEQQLREIAGESQLTLSQYIRKKIQEQPIVKVYQPKELLKQLSGIGNNVNQIARHANTYHTVSDGEIQQIQKDISEIKSKFYQMIREADVLCQS